MAHTWTWWIAPLPLLTRGAYQVSVEGQPSKVGGSAKQVAVELTIGNDGGKTTITAKRDN